MNTACRAACNREGDILTRLGKELDGTGVQPLTKQDRGALEKLRDAAERIVAKAKALLGDHEEEG